MLREKQKHLVECARARSRKIRVNYHDSKTSFLEGVFAKGDRRLAPVILEAYKRGCFFDGWDECFRYDTWMQTFADLGVDPFFYCQRPIGLDEVTPWSHMDYGVTHEYLVREYQKALAAQTTQPCNRACQRLRRQPSVRRCPALITVRISFDKERMRPPTSRCWTCSG